MLDNMKGLMAYSGLSAKIRAMQGRLLSEEDFLTLVRLPDVTAAAARLKQLPAYEPVLRDLNASLAHRGDLEPLLRESVYLDFSKIYHFANGHQRSFLELYMMRYETSWLKRCLKAIFGMEDRAPDPAPLERHLARASRLPFTELAAASSLQELHALLQGTRYRSVLSHLPEADSRSLFDYEMALDLYHFSQVWKERKAVVSRAELPKLTEFCGAKFDMLNLQWIRRCKKYYHMSPAEIYALLIPVDYRLHDEELRALVEAGSAEEADRLIAGTWYARHFSPFSGDTLEEDYSRILRGILTHEARRSPYSISAVYAYLYRKEHEVDRLIIALECIRYQVSPEEAVLHLAAR